MNAGFELGRFVDVAYSGTFQLGLSFDNRELDDTGDFDPDRVSIIKLNRDHGISEKITHCVTKSFAIERDLLIGLGIHEVIVIAIVVKIGHLVFFEDGAIDGIG